MFSVALVRIRAVTLALMASYCNLALGRSRVVSLTVDSVVSSQCSVAYSV